MVSHKEEYFEIEEIISMRKIKNKKYYLVKWKGFGVEESTWEPYENVKNCKEILKKFEEKYQN